MKRFDAVIEFFFGRNKYKKFVSPEFPIIEEVIVKDFNISNAIPGYGRNYFKLISDGGHFELFIRNKKIDKDTKINVDGELSKKYSTIGSIIRTIGCRYSTLCESKYVLNIDNLLPYIDSIVIDRDKKTNKIIYLFRFIEMNEEINMDGFLKVTGLAGKRMFEKYNALYLNLK